MDKTANKRQQRYREQIVKGDKRRLQFVIDRDDAEQLNKICLAQGINKTEFIRRPIQPRFRSWKRCRVRSWGCLSVSGNRVIAWPTARFVVALRQSQMRAIQCLTQSPRR